MRRRASYPARPVDAILIFPAAESPPCAGAVDAQGFKAMAGADFFLTGEVRGLSASTDEAQSDYVLIRFQLTDAESGIVSWSSSYEMKKEGSWGVMYQ